MNTSKIFRNLSRLSQLRPEIRRNKVLNSLKKFFKGRKESGDYFKSYDDFYLNLRDSEEFFRLSEIGDSGLESAWEITRRAMDREVCLLSDRFHKAGNDNFNWNRDYVSGYEWNVNYRSISVLHEGADIKNVWELCRLQFLLNYFVVLRQLERNHGKNKEYQDIVEDFTSVLFDFISCGSQGIVKKSSMDIGIGSVTILQLINIARSFKVEFSDPDLRIIREYLLRSLAHIKINPEYSGGMRGNHYLSNVCAQIIIHLSFETRGKQYHPDLLRLLDEFVQEMHYQFGQDGGNFEASLSYHFFALEMALTTLEYIELKAPELNFSLRVEKVFKRICEFTLQFKDIDEIPLIGDNDSGYFFRQIPPELIMMRNNVMLNVNKREYLFEIIENRCKPSKPIPQSEWNLNFDFGLHTYRNDIYFLTLRCGAVGQHGKGGHAHNDQLSINLNVYGKAFIVDSGVYRYSQSAEERNKYRSTELHNILQINAKEQNPIPNSLPDDIFWLKDKTKARIDKCEAAYIEASHVGYGVKCIREINAKDREIEIKDVCKIAGVKSLRIHLHPSCDVKLLDGNSVSITRENTTITISGQYDFILEEYEYCPEYGVKIPAKRLKTVCEENEINWSITIK